MGPPSQCWGQEDVPMVQDKVNIDKVTYRRCNRLRPDIRERTLKLLPLLVALFTSTCMSGHSDLLVST
jgi:hypothetical protein